MSASVEPCRVDHALGQIPLVLGIVGHLDPATVVHETLKSAVRKLLDDIRGRYPSTPIEVLSSLAEGADQLSAEAALEMGFAVRAPLPFPPKIYAQSTSFRTNGPRDKFLRWIDEGRVSWFVVPLPNMPASDNLQEWERLRDDDDGRRMCYANAGAYIVQHCLSLIALWDGMAGDPARPSGTAEMVRFKLSGAMPRCNPWRKPLELGGDTGPVLVVQTTREGQAPPGGQTTEEARPIRVLVPRSGQDRPKTVWERLPNPMQWLIRKVAGVFGFDGKDGARDSFAPSLEAAWNFIEVHGKDWNRPVSRPRWFLWRVFVALGGGAGGWAEFWQFRELARNIDEFNRDLAKAGPRLDGRIQAATSDMLRRDAESVRDDTSNRDQWVVLGQLPQFERLAHARVAAAGLAASLERSLKYRQRELFMTIFIALLSFHVYAHIFTINGTRIEDAHTTHSPTWLGMFLLALLGSAMIVIWVWYSRLDSRRVDYRALSEAIRVRYFWGLAGIDRSVADAYLSQLRGEMAWARRALKSLAPHPREWRTIFERRPIDEQEQCLRCVGERWIGHQARYYHSRHREQHRRAVRLRLFGFLLALVGWGYSASLLVRQWLDDRRPAEGPAIAQADGQRMAAVAKTLTRSDARHPEDWELILPSILVISGGLLIGYTERRAHEALARQYDSMDAVFCRGLREFDQTLPTKTGLMTRKEEDTAREIIEGLGQEALVEHVHWLIVHRVRPFELIIGG
jgi:hypothetical protein